MKRAYNKSVNQSWTIKEQIYLHDNYFKLPIAELAIKLQRSYNAIHAKASDLGLNLHSMKKTKPTIYMRAIPAAPNTPIKSIIVDSPQPKKKVIKNWTKEEVQYLVTNHGEQSLKKLASACDTTVKKVSDKLRTLRLSGVNIPLKDKKAPRKVSIETKNLITKQFKAIGEVNIPTREAMNLPPIEQKDEVYIIEELVNGEKEYTGQVMILNIDDLKIKDLTALSKLLDELGVKYKIK